jgi:hypothetical protein
MRASTVNLGIVLAVAAVLRFWALGHGLPDSSGADESLVLDKIVGIMKSGDFNPHLFRSGGLLFYAHLPVAIAQFLQGVAAGTWTSLDEIGPRQIALWARALTALVGTVTVLLLYQIGARWGARHALLAAGLLAVSPLHVSASHAVVADVPTTFLVTLTMLLSLVAHERATSRAFVGPGVTAGLAFSCSFSAAPVLVVPLVAIWMTLHATPSRVRCLVVMLGGAVAAFVLSTPYALLDLPGFLNGVAGAAAMSRAQSAHATDWFAGVGHLLYALGWPAFLLLLAGFGLGVVRAVRGPGRVRWTLVITLCTVFAMSVARSASVRAESLLPLLPFACLLAAVAVVSGVSLLRRFDIPHAPRRALIAALTVAALLPPLVRSIAFDHRMSRAGIPQTSLSFSGARVRLMTAHVSVRDRRRPAVTVLFLSVPIPCSSVSRSTGVLLEGTRSLSVRSVYSVSPWLPV